MGTLVISLHVMVNQMQSGQTKGKALVLETIHNVTRDQARGYFLDFKGSNKDMGVDPALIQGKWTDEEYFM